MPMETLDVAIIFDAANRWVICTDVEFERWARLSSGQDEFPWQSKFYRPDTTSTWLECRVSEIGISVTIIPG